MMKNIESYLQTMKQFWLQEPPVQNSNPLFYLTPAQRYERLKEIMSPLSQDINIHEKNN
jgi:hypothetical protein